MLGPNSSTPLKDATPTNDNLDNEDDDNHIEQEGSGQIVQIGEISDERDIVESSDC